MAALDYYGMETMLNIFHPKTSMDMKMDPLIK